MRLSNAANDGGFSLVEVLVGLVVFSIGIMALFHLRGESARSVVGLQDRALAQIVAQNRIIETVQISPSLVIGVREGVADLAGREWEWSEEVAETSDAGLRRVQVSVRSADIPDILAEITAFREAR